MDKSFSLLRTNVKLTSNVKFTITASYSFYLDSIESHPDLTKVKYKKFRVGPQEDLFYKIASYFYSYNSTPKELAFYVKDDQDFANMSNNFSRQYDELYYSGAKNISAVKFYDEEFEYLAPLHINKRSLPSHFIIFRIDGPGLLKVDKSNFRSEILNKLKVCKFIDLTPNGPLGAYLKRFVTDNTKFPTNCLFIDYTALPSSMIANDFVVGGFQLKSQNIENFKKVENAYSDSDKFFTDLWMTQNASYPLIINFSFLFDDEPATPNSLRKWSLNRYLGFYFDELKFYAEISPNQLPEIEDDSYVDKNNILKTRSGKQPFSDPDNLTNYPYIEIEGIRYKVLECPCGDTGAGSSKCWKIISDKDLEGVELKPPGKKPGVVKIESNEGINTIKYTDETLYDIPEFDHYDMWLIKIGDMYHKLIRDSLTNEIRIYSDYAFDQTPGQIDYYINDPDPKYRKSIKSEDANPIKFSIYYCKFTDIKDFDTDIVETKFAKYEYEREAVITKSKESKFFLTDLSSQTLPRDTHDFKLGTEVVYIPSSSHYTANHELFRLIPENTTTSPPKYNLNDLWKKNPKILKWGYQNSLSTGNTQYYLNNSLSADDFNRTTNNFLLSPTRIEKNLDYFYTINSDSNQYNFHSLHIEQQVNGQINTDFKFELDKYLGISYSLDYFTYFFGKRNEYQNGNVLKNDKNWSYINGRGTNAELSFMFSFPQLTNHTVFKGLKFDFYKVKSLKLVTKIEAIIEENTNDFENYKFSVLMSQNDYSLEPSASDVTKGSVFPIKNVFKYELYDTWTNGAYYATGSTVIFSDILYKTSFGYKIPITQKTPKGTPFAPVTEKNIFWSPIFDGSNLVTNNNMIDFKNTYKPLVYNFNEYWYLGVKDANQDGVNSNTNISLKYQFWDPNKTYSKFKRSQFDNLPFTTSTDESLLNSSGVANKALVLQLINESNTVIYKGKIFVSLQNSNTVTPVELYKTWKELNFNLYFGDNGTNNLVIWRKVRLWNPINRAYRNQYLVRNGVLYLSLTESFAQKDPETNPDLYKRIHSFDYSPQLTYGPSFSSNDLIKLHESNKIYKILTPDQVTVDPGVRIQNKPDDGVNVYINKKWKNILVNIYSNDNSLIDYIKNRKRDDLYIDLFRKFTARNFTDYINNLEIDYSFFNLIKYIIINEDGSINICDFNNAESAKKLPYRMKIIDPKEYYLSKFELTKTAVPVGENIIKATKKLDNGKIFTYDQINWYSDVPYSNIIKNDIMNRNGFNLITNLHSFYRHSGYYSPIFNEIQLFAANGLTYSRSNYKFDTDLTDFGMTGELVVSKVNKSKNILKLGNSTTQRSIFPMLDEMGYQITKSFIFKSKWDFEYFKECRLPDNSNTNGASLNVVTDDPQGQQ